MPANGPVTLIDSSARATPANQHPVVVIGNGDPTVSYPANLPTFDFSSYGTPAADPITLNSHFTAQYTMVLGNQLGFYNGGYTLTFPINNQTYPNIPSIKVHLGDLVEIHFTNNGAFPIPHVMHLHGHYFTVLAHNGVPLSGSPIHFDSLTVLSGESYDVAFLADNPGLWMLHCHFLIHDAQGMDMMVEYPNISTPFSIGTASGNNPF
jgi:FtsP/CotA-like multicopper oxidase with cupredoxin domain